LFDRRRVMRIAVETPDAAPLRGLFERSRNARFHFA
jgi:hypothetical protein